MPGEPTASSSSEVPAWSRLGLPALVAVACVAATGALWVGLGPAGHTPIRYAGFAILACAAGYLAWQCHPSYTFSFAILLSPLSGNWSHVGVPGAVAPDRLLLICAVAQVLLRSPVMRRRPALRWHAAYGVLAAAALWAIGSAALAHTLTTVKGAAGILDSFGVLPFLTFATAPLAFRGPRERAVLLVALVALGAYLSLTVVAGALHLDGLVFPRYILNTGLGIQVGRGRGPFLDAVANGYACYVCGLGAVIAAVTWRERRLKSIAVAVALLCVVGILLSIERSVWIGAPAGAIAAMALTARLRRYLVATVAGGVGVVLVALALIPGLQVQAANQVANRNSLWDRENLATAAENMIVARPLTGFGWDRFQATSAPYFRQSPTYPLTAVGADVHNHVLLYGAELGLPGAALWVAGLLLGLGAALLYRGPPALWPWRAVLVAQFVTFAVVSNAVPPTEFMNLSLWLFAGCLFAARYDERARPAS